MKITVLYVGSSLLAPLRRAEAEIESRYRAGMTLGAHNCGVSLDDDQWNRVEADIAVAEILFIIHVTDSRNAERIARSVDKHQPRAVVAFNCMPDLMRRTRMGRLDFSTLMRGGAGADEKGREKSGRNLLRRLGSWMSDSVRGRDSAGRNHMAQYAKLASRLPAILKYIPATGRLRDIKNYLYLFCYFLQPTAANIRSMLLFAIRNYIPEAGVRARVPPPESVPSVGVYHPDAPGIFETFETYSAWYQRVKKRRLEPHETIGLLLMRPNVVSEATGHYDGLIRALESQGLMVLPILSTFMDNRDACRGFFLDPASRDAASALDPPRVSQIVSLTGFSFVGGPATNDSDAAVEFLRDLGVPLRSAVSLDFQTLEDWRDSRIGLNPVHTAMQVALPEIDGATEPHVFGGMSRAKGQPEPLADRCEMLARRIARWNRLRTADRADLKLAVVLFCFPPNRGNMGTAADLDVFASLREILAALASDGYAVEAPSSAELLREKILGGNAHEKGTLANVAHEMSVDEYEEHCRHVREIEKEWGRAPGRINSNGRSIQILGARFGNVFVGVQPTFGYEGDPMRMLSAEGGAPHHGFMGFYTYIRSVLRADAVIHLGTHGALEFMPGKQTGLSSNCWPDRLIGDLPHVYVYSVNNPSEGTIAKRRSHAGLVSYLTPPLQNAGLYRGLASMKEMLLAYRSSTNERERRQLFEAIEEGARELHL